MIWTLDTAGMLARYGCSDCRGSGLVTVQDQALPCDCVCRRVFRACYRRFRTCAAADSSARTVSFREMPRGVERRLVWVRRNEDYCADFQAAGRRTLTEELMRVFRFHHLLGCSADLVADRLRTSRPVLYRQIWDIEGAVGRELALMQPYSLYPPHEYMHGGKPDPRKENVA